MALLSDEDIEQRLGEVEGWRREGDAIRKDFDAQSRRKVKKELLDALDAKYSFELPPTLVEQEFAAVWSQVEADMKSNGRTFADEDTTEEEAKAEYRIIL